MKNAKVGQFVNVTVYRDSRGRALITHHAVVKKVGKGLKSGKLMAIVEDIHTGDEIKAFVADLYDNSDLPRTAQAFLNKASLAVYSETAPHDHWLEYMVEHGFAVDVLAK